MNGFVHDVRPIQLHIFLSEADRLLSASPAVFVASPAYETEDNVSPAERERVRKLNEHVWKQTSEGKREYPSAMIRRLVNGFVHDLRPPQLHMFLSEADRILSSSPAVLVASSAQETEKDISPAERERVRKLTHRLHVSGGHVSKTTLRLLLQRRGCPVWMQHMVAQLQCDSCLESSNAQNAQRVSLATPPKLWQQHSFLVRRDTGHLMRISARCR